MPTAESYRPATQSTFDNIDARPQRAIENRAMRSKAGFLLLAGWLASAGCSDAGGNAGDGGGGLAGGAGGAGTGGSGGAAVSDAGVGGAADASAATGCEGVDAGGIVSPAYADMTITASGFAEHEGRSVFLVTRANISGVIGARSVTVTGGRFAFRFPKGYKRSSEQDLLWLIDADGDGRCNTDAGDHTGYLRVNAANPAGSDALEVAITDNHVRTTSGGVDICNPAAPFGDMMDFNITGVGFEAHDAEGLSALHVSGNLPVRGCRRRRRLRTGNGPHHLQGHERIQSSADHALRRSGDGRPHVEERAERGRLHRYERLSDRAMSAEGDG